jgi:hypothetical protein
VAAVPIASQTKGKKETYARHQHQNPWQKYKCLQYWNVKYGSKITKLNDIRYEIFNTLRFRILSSRILQFPPPPTHATHTHKHTRATKTHTKEKQIRLYDYYFSRYVWIFNFYMILKEQHGFRKL